MTQIPPPSQQTISSLFEVIDFCRQGKKNEAARYLVADTRVIAVTPTMSTDIYHLGNAAIKLNLEREVKEQDYNEQLLLMIATLKREKIQLMGAPELDKLYDSPDAPGITYDKDGPVITDRHHALQQVDLDHFTEGFLSRSGAILLQEGAREYENRNLEEALANFRDALRIAKHLENKQNIAVCLFEIGYVMHSYRNSTFAEEHYQEAMSMAAGFSRSDRGLFANYIFRAGLFFEGEGNIEKSRQYFEKALKLFEEAGDKEGIKNCHDKLPKKGKKFFPW